MAQDMSDSTRPSSVDFLPNNSLMKEVLITATNDEEASIKAETVDGPKYVTGFKLALIVGSCSLACFLTLLDTIIISTAIPTITDQFNSLPDVGWYASAYQFASAAPQPLTGKVYTYFNSKWSFLTFFAIFEVGSILCGAAINSNMLIIGRAFAGLGAAGVINGTIIIISSCVPMEKRPVLIGWSMGLSQLGLVAGPLVGGAFTSYTTWRWCFYVNLPIGAFTAMILVLLRVPEMMKKPDPLTVLSKLQHYLDLIGFALFAPAVLQLLLALQYGSNNYAWNSSQVIGLFCGSGATFIVWLIWNYRKGDDALIPVSVVKQTVVWASGLFQSFVTSAVYAAIFFLPIYFQAINNASPIMSGVYLLPLILPRLLGSVLSGAIIQRVGYVIPVGVVGSVLLAVGSGLFSLLQPESPTGYWVGFQVLAGLGSGLCQQLAILTIQAAVGPQKLSTGMGLLIFAQSLGPAISLVICNVIFLASLKSGLKDTVPNVDAAEIIRQGATRFRNIIHPDELPEVLVAYANSIDKVFYFVAALASLTMVVLWGMGWYDIRKKTGPAKSNPKASAKEEEKTRSGEQPDDSKWASKI